MLDSKSCDIYDFLIAVCPPVTLPDSFPWVIEDHGLRGPTPVDLLQQMLGEFSPRELVASGVAVAESPAGQAATSPDLTLHPGLAPERDGLLLLRSDAQCQPFGLLVDGGLLASKRLACVAALEDYRCKAARENAQVLLFVEGLGDLAAMWALGLPAVPAAGLAELGGSRLAEFRAAYTPRPGQRGVGSPLAGGGAKIPTVVLVGWSPASWDCAEPARMRAVAQHLRALSEHLTINLSAVRYWRPDAAELDKLRFIFDHVPSHSEMLAAIAVAGQSAPPLIDSGDACSELVTALGDWRRAVARAISPKDASSATAEIRDLLRAQFTEPLVELAGSTADPVRGSLLMTFAQLTDAIHAEGLRLEGQKLQGITERSGDDARKDRGPLFPLIDRTLALAKILAAPKKDATT